MDWAYSDASRKVMPEVIDEIFNKGALYQVEIPEDDEYLLWDKPLSEQPEKVRAVVEPLMQGEVNRRNEERERLNAASPGRLNHPVIGKLARKVYTSADIRVGQWFQARFPWPYEQVMRRLNREFDSALAAQEVAS